MAKSRKADPVRRCVTRQDEDVLSKGDVQGVRQDSTRHEFLGAAPLRWEERTIRSDAPIIVRGTGAISHFAPAFQDSGGSGR